MIKKTEKVNIVTLTICNGGLSTTFVEMQDGSICNGDGSSAVANVAAITSIISIAIEDGKSYIKELKDALGRVYDVLSILRKSPGSNVSSAKIAEGEELYAKSTSSLEGYITDLVQLSESLQEANMLMIPAVKYESNTGLITSVFNQFFSELEESENTENKKNVYNPYNELLQKLFQGLENALKKKQVRVKEPNDVDNEIESILTVMFGR